MVKCNECDRWFHNERGLNIHVGKTHEQEKPVYVPDLIGMGVMPRKLTRDEASQVTRDVMAMGLKDPSARFTMAILKSIEMVQ